MDILKFKKFLISKLMKIPLDIYYWAATVNHEVWLIDAATEKEAYDKIELEEPGANVESLVKTNIIKVI